MANIAPANFAYVNANGDKGDVQVLSDADITLINEGLQDIEDLKLAIQKPLPAGTIIPFAGNVVPEGFLICNGAAVSRTTYASLFAAIGTLYGTGDGSTTFNLPDARDRVLQGASGTHSTGSYISAGLPNLTGVLYADTYNTDNPIIWTREDHGVFSSTTTTLGSNAFRVNYIEDGDKPRTKITLNANASNSMYSNDIQTVQPSATAVQYLIKY